MPKGQTVSKECDICGRHISMFAFNKHRNSHFKLPKEKEEINLVCVFCGKLYKNKSSLSNHTIRCPLNPNRKIQIMSEEAKERLILSNKSKIWTDEMRKKHSDRMKIAVINNPESYTSSNVCGRTKIYEFNDSKFHGKWELEVAHWLNEQNVSWIRDVKPIDYFWNNAWHLYFPDFYLPDYDLFIEVKGYETDRDRAKWDAVKNIKILKKTEIEQIRKNTLDPVTQW